jgi:hypothetical protein
MELTSSSHSFKLVFELLQIPFYTSHAFFPIPRSEFNFGERDINILLARFRLNFTTLNSDLATRNIIHYVYSYQRFSFGNTLEDYLYYSGLSKLAEDRPGGRGFAPMKI